MSILFVHPPTDAFSSGGNVFNRNIIRQAARSEYPFESVSLPLEEFHARFDEIQAHHNANTIVWDSLYLRNPVAPCSVRWRPGASNCLLLHYLPSMNPLLSVSQRTMLRSVEHKVLNRMDALISTGAGLEQRLRRKFPSVPMITAEPGIDPAFRVPPAIPKVQTPASTRVLTVATLTESKGYTHLLEMLADHKLIPWHWDIVGDPDQDPNYSKNFMSDVESLGLGQRINFHSDLNPEQIAGLMHRADFLASASYSESFGMVVAEATAAGLPVIATRTGESHRFIRHLKSGYLVAPEDWPQYSRLLKKLLVDPDLRTGFRSRIPISTELTWESCFTSFCSITSIRGTAGQANQVP